MSHWGSIVITNIFSVIPFIAKELVEFPINFKFLKVINLVNWIKFLNLWKLNFSHNKFILSDFLFEKGKTWTPVSIDD